MSDTGADHAERAERILDAAAGLILRWGYQRVTMQDVARAAGVGKGTLYLHWRTRESLFVAVLLRESIAMVDALLDRMRADPEVVLLHRMQRVCFEVVLDRPLLRAVYGGDGELLGNLARHASTMDEGRQAAFLRSYLARLREHGLVRADTDLDDQAYAVNCVITGFNLTGPVTADDVPASDARRARALADTLRVAFEPDRRPDARVLRQVAPRVVADLEELRDAYARHRFGDRRPDRQSDSTTPSRTDTTAGTAR
ncbi:TetR/AcrR family transcriptional regulator [Actinokineospora sp. PR83]|uniref:TetR/AcrR family transcriptional regulator n=1 Tax=Actinokineospora sp. PR83 TaxID=2884908 RepID=UPI0027E0FAE7|nr:TetR/AcrR family transcriptional regulator [Actinokineospora sp. PR83]MCG8920252.1 TetR/AcrR family transcriptional regulator [Actinokineospora sp. PR83]